MTTGHRNTVSIALDQLLVVLCTITAPFIVMNDGDMLVAAAVACTLISVLYRLYAYEECRPFWKYRGEPTEILVKEPA